MMGKGLDASSLRSFLLNTDLWQSRHARVSPTGSSSKLSIVYTLAFYLAHKLSH